MSNFKVVDYIIFGATLCVSAGIGIYFGCFGGKQKTIRQYLYANKQMTTLPIALSLYSSVITSLTIIGIPVEVYVFGAQFLLMGVGTLFSLIITWNFILPVFCTSLQFKSPYEYYELRFNKWIRILSSAIYVLNSMLYIPIILLVICLAFSTGTNLPILYSILIIGGICIFYTLLGGFASVIWTDVFQASLMYISILSLIIVAIIKMENISEVFKIADEGQRLNIFDMNPDPYSRLTFWTAIIGFTFSNAAHSGCAASSIQRYLVLKNQRNAKICTLISCIAQFIMITIAVLVGIFMYAYYYKCDPVMNKQVNNPTQIMPLFLEDMFDNLPGLTGIFFAGVLSAGLSTVSAELNTVGGLIYHDFILKIYKRKISDEKGTLLIKLIVLINGLWYLGMSYLLRNYFYVQQLIFVITGIFLGAKLGIMILGTTFPKSNSYGAFTGAVFSCFIIGWLSIGATMYDINSIYTLPTSAENCINISNSTIIETNQYSNKTTVQKNIYYLSFMYYPVLGTFITIIIGVITSYIIGSNDVNKIDQRLLIPQVRTMTQESTQSDSK